MTPRACVFDLATNSFIPLQDGEFEHIKFMATLKTPLEFPGVVRFPETRNYLINRQVIGWKPEQMGILVDRWNLWIYSRAEEFLIFTHFFFVRSISLKSLRITLKRHSIKIEFTL